MSDDLLLGVLRMPIDLAMSTDLARTQYWFRGQEAADRIEADARLIEELRKDISEANSIALSFFELLKEFTADEDEDEDEDE